MIRYALRCSNGHGFESWFRSSEAFDGLAEAGHLSCPDCGVADVGKALMAPGVAASPEGGEPPKVGDAATTAAAAPAALPSDPRAEALARMRAFVEAKSEYVGLRFAAEARRIHSGEAPGRMIHGEARPEEARALAEEGVPVAPLPFLPRNKLS